MEKIFQLILVVAIVTFCKYSRASGQGMTRGQFSDFNCHHGSLCELFETTRNNKKRRI